MEKYVADIERTLLQVSLDAIKRSANPRGRSAENFLPFLPPFNEEVRSVRSLVSRRSLVVSE